VIDVETAGLNQRLLSLVDGVVLVTFHQLDDASGVGYPCRRGYCGKAQLRRLKSCQRPNTRL
jgi:hypothetical protein